MHAYIYGCPDSCRYISSMHSTRIQSYADVSSEVVCSVLHSDVALDVSMAFPRCCCRVKEDTMKPVSIKTNPRCTPIIRHARRSSHEQSQIRAMTHPSMNYFTNIYTCTHICVSYVNYLTNIHTRTHTHMRDYENTKHTWCCCTADRRPKALISIEPSSAVSRSKSPRPSPANSGAFSMYILLTTLRLRVDSPSL